MDFGKAFTFAFDDPDWLKKVGINALIGLIPIIGQVYVLGWGLEVARRIATGSGEPLPDVDFGTYLGHGLKAFVVSLVWTAPIWVFSVAAAGISILAGELDPDLANVVAAITSICGGLLGLIFGLAIGVMLPAALTRTVVFGTIKDGLSFAAVWRLVRAAPGPYLLTLLGSVAAGLLSGIVGSLACGIGVFFTSALYQAIMGHFYGQAYVAATARAQ